MDRATFNILFKICRKHTWLEEKHDSLEHLLFVDCDSEEKREVVLQLIDHIKYISQNEYNEQIIKLTNNITDELDSKVTQIVAMTPDSRSDSAQHVLVDLKFQLGKKNWNGYLSVNRYDHSFKEAKKKNFVHINLVLIDNFIGSGDTVLGRISTLKKLYEGYKINFFVKVLFCTKYGKERLDQENINLFVAHDELLKKVIDDNYEYEKANVYKKIIREIESKLLPNFNDRDLPSLGYKDSQIAFAIEKMNTPNNVFPIFWWKYYYNTEIRAVILDRAMDDA